MSVVGYDQDVGADDVTAADGTDVLDVGDSLRLRRRWWPTVAAALAIACGVAYAVDRHDQDNEFAALLQCVRAGQSAISHAKAQVSSVAAFVTPALRSGPSGDVRAGLVQRVAGVAGEEVPAVRRAGARCHRLGLRYWHRTGLAARQAYTEYLDAWAAFLEATSQGGDQAMVEHPELALRLAGARDAVAAAAPSGADRRRAASLLR